MRYAHDAAGTSVRHPRQNGFRDGGGAAEINHGFFEFQKEGACDPGLLDLSQDGASTESQREEGAATAHLGRRDDCRSRRTHVEGRLRLRPQARAGVLWRGLQGDTQGRYVSREDYQWRSVNIDNSCFLETLTCSDS